MGVNNSADTDMPDLCSTAVREAKKWLKEKKLTDSKSEFDHGTCSLNPVMALPVSDSFRWSLSGVCCPKCMYFFAIAHKQAYIYALYARVLCV